MISSLGARAAALLLCLGAQAARAQPQGVGARPEPAAEAERERPQSPQAEAAAQEAAQEQEVSDAALAERVRSALSGIEALDEVRVEVRGGVAYLRGEVPGQEARRQAEELAGKVSGVLSVVDQLRESRDLRRQLEPAAERLRDLAYDLLALLPLLAVAAVVMVLAAWLARLVGRWDRLYARFTRNPFLGEVARGVARAAVLLAGALMAVEVLGATALVGALLGTAGLVGLAIGFAFRDVVENSIASVLLSLRKPFEPDDHVVVEGKEGKVLRLTSRATLLMTLDGNHLRIPNAVVFKGTILNYTRNRLRRFDVSVPIPYDADLGEAQRLGLEALAATQGVLDDPNPATYAETLTPLHTVVSFQGWMDQRNHDFAAVRSEALRRVKRALDAAIEDLRAREREGRARGGSPAAAQLAVGPGGVGRNTLIERQMERERRELPEQDLLDPRAPRE